MYTLVSIIPSLPFRLRHPPTRPTGPLSRDARWVICVLFSILMSTGAVRLTGTLGASTLATQYVFTRGDRLQVVRIEARSIAAQVVQRESFWDRPNKELVGDSVDVSATVPVVPYLPIAITSLGAAPLPASVLVDDRLSEQTLNERFPQVLTPVIFLKRRRDFQT